MIPNVFPVAGVTLQKKTLPPANLTLSITSIRIEIPAHLSDRLSGSVVNVTLSHHDCQSVLQTTLYAQISGHPSP